MKPEDEPVMKIDFTPVEISILLRCLWAIHGRRAHDAQPLDPVTRAEQKLERALEESLEENGLDRGR